MPSPLNTSAAVIDARGNGLSHDHHHLAAAAEHHRPDGGVFFLWYGVMTNWLIASLNRELRYRTQDSRS
jgi:hypothetical protein